MGYDHLVIFNTRNELEQLLEEEKQAKKDEEIVRGLQVAYKIYGKSKTFFLKSTIIKARMLTEEWERREALEKLQETQNEMLNKERNKREEWEQLGTERAAQMREAEKKVMFANKFTSYFKSFLDN